MRIRKHNRFFANRTLKERIMEKIFEELSKLITADNIALLSVIITVLIFVFTRRAEIRYKKHDDKKVQYLKLIKLLEIMFASAKSKSGSLELTDELRAQFFDTGASLLLYGSKKIYRLYLLFREYTTNPLIGCCKYYNSNDTLHIMSEILVTIRKEVGLSNFNSIANNEALAFFVNDISSNPIAKVDASKSKFRIRMTRFELFMIDRSKFVWVKKFVYYFIKPIFSAFYIVLKHVIFVPLGRLLGVVFPSLKSTTDVSKK